MHTTNFTVAQNCLVISYDFDSGGGVDLASLKEFDLT